MTSQPTSFSSAELAKSYKPVSPFNASGNSQELEAVLSKMVPEPRRGTTARQRANISTRALNNGTLKRIAQRTSADIQDAKSLFQILPDLELAMQILISSILSPKDLSRGRLGYTVETGRFNSDVTAKLVTCIKEFFDGTYKINELLPKILEDVLFFKGSYPILILPENAIDEIINRPERVSFESIVNSDQYRSWMTDSIGLLGPGYNPNDPTSMSVRSGMEDFGRPVSYTSVETKMFAPVPTRSSSTLDLHIRVMDNPDIFKRRSLMERLQRERVSQVLGNRQLGNRFNRGRAISVERLQSSQEAISASQAVGGGGVGNITGVTRSFSDHGIYKGRRSMRVSQVSTVPNQDALSRPSVGHPLVIKLPAESVIPVHVPGEPENHVGYFIVMDENGNAVCYESSRDYYSDMGLMLKQNESMTSQIIQTTRRVTQGQHDPNILEDQKQLEEAYVDLVEADLMRRLQNGAYGGNVEIARPEEIYRLMLARTYSQRVTQLLYVPAEMLTYIAFDYNEYGIGVSLLQQTKMIGGIRATLLFANTMASIKNSIARTRLHITLDPEDPEPDMTVEEFIHNYVRNSRGMLPIGVNEPNDIVAHLNNAAVEIEVDGGNPRYPETKMLVENYAGDKTKPDTDLEDSMRDRHLMGIGIPPELITNAKNLEFATQIVQNNLLMTRNVMKYQDLFLPFLEEFVTHYTANSQPLMDQLRDIVRANIDTLSRSQRNDHAEATADGRVDVEDEDLAALVSKVKDKSQDDSVGIDAVVYEFLQALRLTLPSPETNAIKNQKESLDEYEQALDKMLGFYFSADFLTQEFMGEMSEVIDPVQKAIKAIYMRQYARSNNLLPELDDLSIFDPNEGPALDLLQQTLGHEDGLRATILSYMKHVHERLKLSNPQYTASKDAAGAAGGGSDFSSPTPEDEGGDGFSDIGGDDFSIDGDLGGDSTETTTEETTETETETETGGEDSGEAGADATPAPDTNV